MLHKLISSVFAKLLEHFMNTLTTKSYVFGSNFQSGRVKNAPGPCCLCLMQTPKIFTETGPRPLYSDSECVLPRLKKTGIKCVFLQQNKYKTHRKVTVLIL